MTNPQNKTEFADNKLNDTPEDRDIWDRLLDSEASNIEMENMMSEAENAAKNGKLSPMDE